MEALESLERDLAEPFQQAMDAYIPEPSTQRLLDIEQSLKPGRGNSQNKWLWIAVLLGIAGFASAYLYESSKKPVPDKSEVEQPLEHDEKRSETIDQIRIDMPDTGDTTESPVIYQQEVMNND